MRPFGIGPAVTTVLTLMVAGCAHPPAPKPPAAPAQSPPSNTAAVNPANIKRVVRDLPPGYEVTTGIPVAAAPKVIWGLAADARAKPPRCAVLADPGNGRDQSAQGVSGSGSGGIVDAVVVALPEPVDFPRDLLGACQQWSEAAGHTTVRVRLTDGPHIDGVETLGMVADITSSVESGTEIDSRSYTFIAYLGDYYAFTTLTTDPGAAVPVLPPQFAADLLAKTVSTLRS
ncbi:DUF5642 family protein [Mycobacterium avium]|uniref:Uncharacterized protein n=2 Tax=Mycobacterium avium TaxID=1764 RepID=A0AAI8SKT0_MYCAV|nr:DUF5642 family protein [Mycobacterium avium]TXA42288.1 hypothetical protein DKM27_07980 [Mycobacterium tuberculosis variant bovis]KDP01991.1 hypothetical protein MAV3388_05095 [Mycobacterium avium subsp. hominissuis 3388]KDP08105.1 hypothetical protein MAV101_05675 [Mycobacterium avium subsp. hominissuis 101]KDP10851.1 hypothetical protein MAV100_05185 [Mycobacterium avium subsp. hominissuis 100]MBZ4502796.1 hypothetical protein [Mycobacterium avium subsp. hominissuis]